MKKEITTTHTIEVNKDDETRCGQFDNGDKKNCPYIDLCYEEAVCRLFQKILVNPTAKAAKRCKKCLEAT